MHEICEGDIINDNIGDDDVASVEEAEMGSSEDYEMTMMIWSVDLMHPLV